MHDLLVVSAIVGSVVLCTVLGIAGFKLYKNYKRNSILKSKVASNFSNKIQGVK